MQEKQDAGKEGREKKDEEKAAVTNFRWSHGVGKKIIAGKKKKHFL